MSTASAKLDGISSFRDRQGINHLWRYHNSQPLYQKFAVQAMAWRYLRELALCCKVFLWYWASPGTSKYTGRAEHSFPRGLEFFPWQVPLLFLFHFSGGPTLFQRENVPYHKTVLSPARSRASWGSWPHKKICPASTSLMTSFIAKRLSAHLSTLTWTSSHDSLCLWCSKAFVFFTASFAIFHCALVHLVHQSTSALGSRWGTILI